MENKAPSKSNISFESVLKESATQPNIKSKKEAFSKPTINPTKEPMDSQVKANKFESDLLSMGSAAKSKELESDLLELNLPKPKQKTKQSETQSPIDENTLIVELNERHVIPPDNASP